MAFDLSFNFRATAGYVTDGPEGVPVLLENYPHTYTNGNGQSINAGWVDTPSNKADRANTNDPRIAGINFVVNGAPGTVWKADLSSGSAPGAGDYAVDLAIGDASGTDIEYFELLDNTTVLIDGLNGGSGFVTANGHYIDATLTDVAATTTWTGTPVVKSFASTTVNLRLGNGTLGSATRVAHLRLTLQGGAADVRYEHIAHGIGRGILIGR